MLQKRVRGPCHPALRLRSPSAPPLTTAAGDSLWTVAHQTSKQSYALGPSGKAWIWALSPPKSRWQQGWNCGSPGDHGTSLPSCPRHSQPLSPPLRSPEPSRRWQRYLGMWHPRQANRVTPSGRFPSDLRRPVGSSLEGIWAADKPRFTMSFKAECRKCLPSLFLQLSECLPNTSTSTEQCRHWCLFGLKLVHWEWGNLYTSHAS